MSDRESEEFSVEVKSPLAARFRGFLPVVVDVETGGFNAMTDALLEIAATTLTMDSHGLLKLDKTSSFHIKPFEGANIEKAALEFTGIDLNHPFRIATTEHDALESIFRDIRTAMKKQGCTRAILVGHNAFFDQSFLQAAIERTEIKRSPFHPFSTFDTATLAGLAFGQTVLAKACEAAGIEFNNQEAHSARYDTEKTAELFCYIINKWKKLGGWPL